MKSKKFELIFLAVLGIASIFLRFYGISKPDFYFDEAIQAMSIKDYIATGNFSHLYLFGHPPMFMLLMYIPALLFGVSEFSIRLAEAFFGTLAVFVVYYLAKMWYSKRTAVLASLLFAVAPLPVLYTRLAYGYGISMFFTICSILSIEYLISRKLEKRKEILLILLSGIFIGLTFLTRYNSLPVFFLYWLFVLSYSFFKERVKFKKYLYYLFILHAIALAFFILTVLVLGGMPRLIYTAQNFLFVIQQQSTELRNPFYYHIAVLFDGVSPFLYILLPFALIYLLFHKKSTRADILLSFIVVIFFMIVTIQARRFSRHQLAIYPLLIILLSRFIIEISGRLKKAQAMAFSGIIIMGTLAWSIFIIYQTNDFNTWTEVGNYIERNYDKSIKIHSGYIRNRQVRTHIDREIVSSLDITDLSKGDLVIFAFFEENSTILENSPFEDKSTIFRNEYAGKRSRMMEFGPDYYKYVIEHGKLARTFEYKGGVAVWIYEITSAKDKNFYRNTGIPDSLDTKTKLFGLWDFVCSKWNGNGIISKAIMAITSEQQKTEIEKRCRI